MEFHTGDAAAIGLAQDQHTPGLNGQAAGAPDNHDGSQAAAPETKPSTAITAPPSTAPTPAGPAPKARSIKTPVQKEALEAAYQLKKFPEEDVRRALGERIGLTEQQVQVWFSHKRRKEKKDQEEAAIRQAIEERHAQERQDQQQSAVDAVPPPGAKDSKLEGSTVAAAAVTNPAQPPSSNPQSKGELGNTPAPFTAPAVLPSTSGLDPPLVSTGGVPGAEGKQEQKPPMTQTAAGGEEAPAASALPESVQRTIALGRLEPPPQLTPEQREDLPELIALARSLMPVPFREDGPQLVFEFDEPPLIGPDGTYADEMPVPKRKRVDGDDDDIERKRRATAGAKGSTRHEAERMEKERKRAEEKAEKERKKQEIARTKEEIRLRQLQEKETKKLQAQAEKDRKAQERKDRVTERKKEKEMLKALQAQEKQATRLRQRDAGTGPKDDLELEWEALVAAQQDDGYASGTEAQGQKDPQPIVRPEFPPPSLGFSPLFPPEIGDQLGADLLFVWSFLHSFGDLFGVRNMTVDQLLRCLIAGEKSQLLGEIHIGMIRIVQADMEEAHATGAMQSGSAINFFDRGIVQSASMLEEAWAWGYDVDAWRSHLNGLTWPEVVRQLAIVCGLGPKRPKPKKEVKPKMGTEGEDLVTDDTGELKLRLPARFGIGTVKAAAWQVLADSGPDGLSIAEIARRIQQSGLRDLRTSKTPEASVAGALSRDVIFARTAPATYALQAVVNYNKELINGEQGQPKGEGQASEEKDAVPKSETAEEGAKVKDKAKPDHDSDRTGAADQEKKSEEQDNGDDEEEHEGDSSGDDEDDEEHEGKGESGEPWVLSLSARDYSNLDVQERATILVALVHLAIEGPTLRNTMDSRIEEALRVRKQMWEEARTEKKRRQAEAAAKAKAAADEAQRVMELIKGKEGSLAPSETPDPSAPAGQDRARVVGGSTAVEGVENSGAERPSVTVSARGTPEPNANPAAGAPAPSRDASVRPSSLPTPANVPPAAEKPSAARAGSTEKASAPALERKGSGVAPSEGGQSRRAENDEDVSAAAAAKQRQLQRAETIRKAEEANAIRGEPLGLDRRHNRYWRFADAENCAGDPFAGRLIVEMHEDGSFRMLGKAEGVDGLIAALDKRGAREGPLYNALLRYRDVLAQTMPTTPMTMPEPEEEHQLRDSHREWLESIPCMAERAAEGKFPLPDEDTPVATIKRYLLLVRGTLPREALQEGWDPKAWEESVKAASDTAGLKRALGTLEAALLDGWLSVHFVRSPVLVRGAWGSSGDEVDMAVEATPSKEQQSPQTQEGSEQTAEVSAAPQEPLSWLPATLAAVSLRLLSLDASVIYRAASQAARETQMVYRYTQRPAVLPKAATMEAKEQSGAHKQATVSTLPLGPGGRSLPTLTPPFPLALQTGKRQRFSLDWGKLEKEIADEKAGILPPPTIPKRPSIASEKVVKGSRTRRASTSKAIKAGKGKGTKSGKGKGKQSALREEFDRQSEEEEAAERRGFSTPGFSEDDSDDDQPRGTRRRPEDEDMEISD